MERQLTSGHVCPSSSNFDSRLACELASSVELASAAQFAFMVLVSAWHNGEVHMNPDSPTPAFIYGTAWKEDRTASLTELAIQTGFRAIDTANQRRHYHEAGVGEALTSVYQSGLVTRKDLFLQTKYTSRGGQDHRLPYDPSAPVSAQVAQSMESSLQHLGTDYVDSLVLHGPASGHGWTSSDSEAWEAMIKERDAGRTRMIGVSNVSITHLRQMAQRHAEAPAFVQNRCFASMAWDNEVRSFCQQQGIIYQGFSLLTANWELVRHPSFIDLAGQLGATPAQVVFAFARAVGILPLTGTSDAEHMKEDLASANVTLPTELVSQLSLV